MCATFAIRPDANPDLGHPEIGTLARAFAICLSRIELIEINEFSIQWRPTPTPGRIRMYICASDPAVTVPVNVSQSEWFFRLPLNWIARYLDYAFD